MVHKNIHDPNKNTSNKNIREEISEYDYMDFDELSEFDYMSPEELAEEGDTLCAPQLGYSSSGFR